MGSMVEVEWAERPVTAVDGLAWLHLLLGIFSFAGVAIVFAHFRSILTYIEGAAAISLGYLNLALVAVAILLIVMGILYLLCAYLLYTRQEEGRWLAILLAVIGLFGFPVGSVISIVVGYILLFRPKVIAEFKE